MRITVTDDAHAFRRRVRPLAWTTFEELCLGAEVDADGRLSALVGVRELAARLGVNKDTAARAVGVLTQHGVVLRVTRPLCGYVIVALPAGVTVDHDEGTTERRVALIAMGFIDDARDDCPKPPDAPSIASKTTARPVVADARRPRDAGKGVDVNGGEIGVGDQGRLFG